MERRRGQIIVLAITFIIAIIGLGVAFAAFSTSLSISGSATVQASSWNVYFTKTSKGSAAGTTGVSVTPTATNTQSGISSTASGTGTLKTAEFTWDGTFKTPGDKLTYTFYIYNKGTYTAKLTTLTKPTPTCTKGGSAETTVCGYITYNLYTNSGGTTPLAANSTLAPDALILTAVSGTATVQASSWNIFFTSTSTGSKPSSASALPTANISTNGTATSTSTSLSSTAFTFAATLKTPGDYVTYKFYARNLGSYNAKIKNVISPAVTCTYQGGTSGDAQSFCNSHVEYKIYSDSACTTEVGQNDTLAKTSGTATYCVKLMLKTNFATDGSDLPQTAVNINATQIGVIYEQTN